MIASRRVFISACLPNTGDKLRASNTLNARQLHLLVRWPRRFPRGVSQPGTAFPSRASVAMVTPTRNGTISKRLQPQVDPRLQQPAVASLKSDFCSSAVAGGATHLVTGDVADFGSLFGRRIMRVFVLTLAEFLRKKGLIAAVKKAGRTAAAGLVHSYIHAGGKIGVLVEVNCETDFVAKTAEFQTFVRDLGMQIAAMNPSWVSADEIPAAAIEKEREIRTAQARESGKPETVIAKIVEGQIKKWHTEACLLDQCFVKENKKDIKQLLGELVAKVGENCKIRRFVRWEVGEGIEVPQKNFAEEIKELAR